MKYCSACKTSYPTDFQVCPKDGAALSQTTELLPGLIIREKYQILEKIGAGGMATVYRARHLDFNEIFAIKLINHQFVDDESFIKRLRAEAVIARKLRHPHAVRIEDLDRTEDGRLFIVMEHVEGQDLRRLIRKKGALPVQQALGIAGQVCSALSAAHALGIVHRDIKPDNIQLVATADGSDFVKVLDFGIAKLRRTAANDESLTGSGLLLGTPQYLSPEQAMGKTGAHIDGRSDLYSLGIVVYEMLTGRVPFESDTPMGLLVHHLHTMPRPPQQVRPDLHIPQPVSELLMHALQKQPENRFQSADEMLRAIKAVEAELQAHAEHLAVPAPTAVFAAAARPAPSPGTGVAATGPKSQPLPPPATRAAEIQTHQELLRAAYEGERPFPWRLVGVLSAMLLVGIVAGFVYSHFAKSTGTVAGTTAAASQPAPPPKAAAKATHDAPPPKPATSAVRAPARVNPGPGGSPASPQAGPGAPAANTARAEKVAPPLPSMPTPAAEKLDARSGQSNLEPPPSSKVPARATQISSQVEPASLAAHPAAKRRQGTKPPPSPEVETLLQEAQSFFENADYDTALQDYDEVLKLDPTNSAAIQGKKKAMDAKAYEEGLNH